MMAFGEDDFENFRETSADLEGRIETGSTETVSVSGLDVSMATYRFRLKDYNQTTDTEVVPRNLSYGESYTNHRGMSISVQDIEVNRSYQRTDGGKETPDGSMFAFVEFKAENVGDEPNEPESGEELWLVTKDGDVQLNSFDHNGGDTYPVFDTSELEPGETRTGYAIFELDYGVGKEDIDSIKWLGEANYIETEIHWKPQEDSS